jgi:hypothetical protein
MGEAPLANATVIDFNNYLSPTNNDLTNNFSQTGATTSSPYTQVPTGGVTGGAVTGSTDGDYRATAVYNQSTYDLSTPGATVSLSMDVFYNGNLQPLAPGANGVRSFRLGLLGSATSAFETVGQPAVYIDGIYSLSLGAMIIEERDQTSGVLISTGTVQTPLSQNHWYQVDATFANGGGNQILYTGSFLDLGPNGNAIPIILGTWSWSQENDQMASSNAVYAGFAGLANGGISLVDNFGIPTSETPLPATLPFFAGGLGLIVWTGRRRCVLRRMPGAQAAVMIQAQ